MEVTFSAYINYRNYDDKFLCFLHAVEQARQGNHIITTISEYDMQHGCIVCSHMRMEEDKQAKKEILREVEE